MPKMRIFVFLLLAFSVKAKELPKVGMHSELPAKRWQEALVTGNGRLGAMVYGKPFQERIIFNHEKLYEPLRDKVVKAPKIAKDLPQIRALIAKGDFAAANELMYEKMVENGYPGILWTNPYHPGYAMKLEFPQSESISDYYRATNFQTGEVVVSWKDSDGGMIRRTFVSRADNVIVQEIKRPEGGAFSVRLSLDGQGIKLSGNPKKKNGQGGFHDPVIKVASDGLDWKLKYQKTSRGYYGHTRVITDATVSKDGKGLQLDGARKVLLLTRLTVFEDDHANHLPSLKNEVAKISNDYRTLRNSHQAIHGEMFDRVSLELGGEDEHHLSSEKLLENQKNRPPNSVNVTLLEKMFQMGLYSVICSNGDYPPNLMGIWNGDTRPDWSGDFTLDSNINLQTSAINLANLPECVESYWKLIEELMPSWRENARSYYGCRGVLAGCRTSGRENHQVHHSKDFPGAAWTGAAQWLAAPLIEYVQVSGDERFLRENLLPLLQEICLFYTDFLSTKDEDGHLVFAPSMSPENKAGNTGLLFAANATMDVACAREAFSATIEFSKQLELNLELIPKWENTLQQIRPFLYEKDGSLKEWADSRLADNEDHRHASHLYPAYPGHQARPDLDEKLYHGAALAAKQRGRGNGSAHGLSFMAIFGARLHDAELIYGNLDYMLRGNYILPSLFTWHNPGRIYNSDMLHSLPTAIMEMLAYSRPGVLELFPALPKEFSQGQIKGMMTRSRCRIADLRWDLKKKTVSLALEPLHSQSLRLRLPFPAAKVTVDSKELSLPHEKDMGIRLQLKKGEKQIVQITLE